MNNETICINGEIIELDPEKKYIITFTTEIDHSRFQKVKSLFKKWLLGSGENVIILHNADVKALEA